MPRRAREAVGPVRIMIVMEQSVVGWSPFILAAKSEIG